MYQAVLLSFGNSSFWLKHLHFVSVFLQDISTVYQIFPDEVLGSGQFGIVYGGNVPVYLQGVLWHEPPVRKSSGIYIKRKYNVSFTVFKYLHLP